MAVLVIMLVSIAYDLVSPWIIGRIEEMIKGDFTLPPLLRAVGVYAGVLVVSMVCTYFQALILQKPARKSFPPCGRICFLILRACPMPSLTRSLWASW